jgi:3-hydroxyisobutyrate dehydrogenase-like beta-hydroxyacid dehydrogenase
MAEKVGFIGLGDMGLPMAKRVQTCGYETTVCGHRRREPLDIVKGLDAKEVAEASDVTILALPDDIVTGQIAMGPDGAIAWGMKNGADEKLLVELMTIGTGDSWVVQNWDFIKTVNSDPPSPMQRLGAKDLEYALKIGHIWLGKGQLKVP